jgi:hypothetical protein
MLIAAAFEVVDDVSGRNDAGAMLGDVSVANR